MEIMESIRVAFKELIVPELDRIKEENREIRAILDVTNKRLDDVNVHLADQSRRIDSLREELGSEIKETNKRIDSLRQELGSEIKETNKRIDSLRSEIKETNKRIDTLRDELSFEIKETNKRIDSLREELSGNIIETNKRIDRLYEVIVRRDEHTQVVERLISLEREVEAIKRNLAA